MKKHSSWKQTTNKMLDESGIRDKLKRVSVHNEMSRIAALVDSCGGELHSRQVIAAVVARMTRNS